MIETAFEYWYTAARRAAAVRAAMIARRYRLPGDAALDLEQEALAEIWRKRGAYDARRGSWRTFSEQVVSNRMRSLIRSMRSERCGQFREDPLEEITVADASGAHLELRADVSRVLAGVSRFDHDVAICLADLSAVETGHRLRVSRATIYRAIVRLRTAFAAAGLGTRSVYPACTREQPEHAAPDHRTRRACGRSHKRSEERRGG